MSHCPLTRSALSLLSIVWVCVGCGTDPILEAAEAMDPEEATTVQAPPSAGEPGEPGEPGVVQPGEENMEPGVPEEPEPAFLKNPSRLQQGLSVCPRRPVVTGCRRSRSPESRRARGRTAGVSGGAAHAGKEGQMEEAGPQVIIRGVVTGEPGIGRVRIDLFDGDQRNVSGPRPKVVGVHDIDDVGVFELSVAASAKRIWLGAYRDGNDNKRPDKGEPFGWFGQNPIYLDDIPARIEVKIESEGKASGLGLDFGE